MKKSPNCSEIFAIIGWYLQSLTVWCIGQFHLDFSYTQCNDTVQFHSFNCLMSNTIFFDGGKYCLHFLQTSSFFSTWLIFVSFDQVMIGGWHWWILMHFYYTSRKLRSCVHWEVSLMNNLHLYNARFWRVLVHSEVVSIMLY